MASEVRALEELHSELTCSVCLDLFREPVILECGHHFCRVCITRCWDAKPDESPTCPQCRKTCTSNLRPNSLLCNVVESVRRARAMDTRPRVQSVPQGDVVHKPPGAASGSDGGREYCQEHEEKLKLFCEDDQVAICLVCGMSRDHRMHNVIPISEAFENYKEQLTVALQRVHLQMEQAERFQAQTNQTIVAVKEQTAALEDQIAQEFRQLREFLDHEEEDVKGRLQREKEHRMQRLAESLAHAAGQLSSLQAAEEQLHRKLQQEENPALLRGMRDFILRSEPVFHPPKELSVDLQPGEFVGPLQYRVWRKMRSILHPDTKAVTLDPDTAYPRLMVSACRTRVSVGEIQPNLPDNPERFTRYNIVLGSEGFVSGRHYWEVEVGEKTAWGLGVAAESVNRKEEINLCPEDGFWTLVLRNGDEYEACTSMENLLRLPRQPQSIGIYLDYPRGLVSFYDARDMSHIFTFTDTFKEKVYPYFNPWPIMNGRNREPLVIVTLPP
ncbi:E3 ubiquitin-protein ligase TRIM39-like [Brienomyrus brachyistius]|uniref:E3 ubiquitin-protein ligase TRIM39-like n=1 Tax=Brienomyrus brachyistius TaxID=42636 RepID=UPI0020B2C493|nr:E3 ubiquitin-protein ligase TRIM39-like [Brienomyrus brachyistius]